MKDVVITINGKELIAEDKEANDLLEVCLLRANNRLSEGGECSLFVVPRDKDGWMQIGMAYTYTSGSKMFVGAIQRNFGSVFEFHS